MQSVAQPMSPFIVIIPARLASTRLPNKPLADLGGKPMVVRVAERAALAGASRIIVATDHEDIRMRKVDEAQHAVHHGVPEGDQRIDRAELEAIKQLLEEFRHADRAVDVRIR